MSPTSSSGHRLWFLFLRWIIHLSHEITSSENTLENFKKLFLKNPSFEFWSVALKFKNLKYSWNDMNIHYQNIISRKSAIVYNYELSRKNYENSHLWSLKMLMKKYIEVVSLKIQIPTAYVCNFWTGLKIWALYKTFISNSPLGNRYRRGLETCPQAKTSKSGHAILFSFFRRVRATSMSQYWVEKYSRTFLYVFVCTG